MHRRESHLESCASCLRSPAHCFVTARKRTFSSVNVNEKAVVHQPNYAPVVHQFDYAEGVR
jgi:hypothetical protein